MLSQIFDRLYGVLEFSKDDLALFQTPEISRLHQLSMSAIPPWLTPAGTCASRFEHTFGVVYLARIVGQKVEFEEVARDLNFAAFAHDIGTPPFSHLSEHFQKLILGKNHEEFSTDVMGDSELAKEIKRQGGNPRRIIELINGKLLPWGMLINGSVDLDNLDNTLRYGLSMGLFRSKLYSPVFLANAFCLGNDGLSLSDKAVNHLSAWQKCRLKAYSYVHSPANLSPGMMLFRAIDLAMRHQEITPEFFLFTDYEAFSYLGEKCNLLTRSLIERVRLWQFYQPIFSFSTVLPSDAFAKAVEDPTTRFRMADAIGELLKIPQEDICFYAGKDRGFKRLGLPIVDENGVRSEPSNSILTPIWHIQVFLHQKWVNSHCEKQVEEYIKSIFELSV